MSKHTPGPWKYDPEMEEVLDGNDYMVADIWGGNGPSIAAAPTLLGFVEDMLAGTFGAVERVEAAQLVRNLKED